MYRRNTSIRLFFIFFTSLLAEICDGKVIRSINIKIYDVFENSELEFIKPLNKLKINSKQSSIKRLLLTKEGEVCSSIKLNETERKLRSLGVFRTVNIQVIDVNDNYVDIEVIIQDNWTINIKGGIDSQNFTPKNFGIQDKNLFGRLKNLNINWVDKTLYDEWEALFEDRAFGPDDTKYSVLVADKSAGYKYGLKLDNSISDLVRGTGFNSSFIRDKTIFQKRADSNQYKKDLLTGKLGYEKQFRLSENAWIRVEAGLKFEEKSIEPQKKSLGSETFVYRWLGPAFKVSYLRPTFKTVDYFNYFNYLESVDVGSGVTTEIFTSPGLSKDETVVISNALSIGAAPNEKLLWFGNLKHQFRCDNFSDFNNSIIELNSSLYNFFEDRIFNKPGSLVTQLNLLASRDLDLDREFSLGGEKGLLGYKNNSLSDSNVAYSKIEIRNTLIENYKNLVSLGSAIFIEFGSSAPVFENLKDNYLANVGVGIRIFLPDISPPRTFRLDVAIPIVSTQEVGAFELRFTATEEKVINRSLFEEPELFDKFQNLGILD